MRYGAWSNDEASGREGLGGGRLGQILGFSTILDGVDEPPLVEDARATSICRVVWIWCLCDPTSVLEQCDQCLESAIGRTQFWRDGVCERSVEGWMGRKSPKGLGVVGSKSGAGQAGADKGPMVLLFGSP